MNEPSGLARAALMHLERATRFGVPRAELLREARLNEEQLHDPDARVSRSAIGRLWRAVASRVPDSAFGLRYGAEFRLREFGLVGYAMAFSRTVGGALTLRPEINLLLYHGVLAPHARWRAQVVSYGRPVPAVAAPGPVSSGSGRAGARGPRRPRNSTWAGLMRRAFAINVLACPRRGGRLRMVGTVEDPVAVRQILAAPRSIEPIGPDPPTGVATMGVLISSG